MSKEQNNDLLDIHAKQCLLSTNIFKVLGVSHGIKTIFPIRLMLQQHP